MNKSQLDRLAKAKTPVEKNEWYLYLLQEVEKQVNYHQRTIGSMRKADLGEIRLEQGKITALNWFLGRPDKLMKEIIDSMEK